MDEFPSNSLGGENDQASSKPRVERITSAKTVEGKRDHLGRRLLKTFVQGDIGRSWSDVVSDILVPAARDVITQAVTSGFEQLIYGERQRPSSVRRSSYGVSGGSSYTSYNRYGRGPERGVRPNVGRPEYTDRARQQHDFSRIVTETRAELEEVLNQMLEVLDQYGTVTVHDFHGLVGVTSNFADEKFGWDDPNDLRSARVVRSRDGYYLDITRPIQLR